MIEFILGIILGMWLMYKLSKINIEFNITYNKDEEDK